MEASGTRGNTQIVGPRYTFGCIRSDSASADTVYLRPDSSETVIMQNRDRVVYSSQPPERRDEKKLSSSPSALQKPQAAPHGAIWFTAKKEG